IRYPDRFRPIQDWTVRCLAPELNWGKSRPTQNRSQRSRLLGAFDSSSASTLGFEPAKNKFPTVVNPFETRCMTLGINDFGARSICSQNAKCMIAKGLQKGLQN